MLLPKLSHTYTNEAVIWYTLLFGEGFAQIHYQTPQRYITVDSQGNRLSFLELLYKLRHNKQAFKALLYKCALQAARKMRYDALSGQCFT